MSTGIYYRKTLFYIIYLILLIFLPALLLKIALQSKGKFLQQLTRHSVRLLVGDFLVIREFLVLRDMSFDTPTEFPHSGKSIIYITMFGFVVINFRQK